MTGARPHWTDYTLEQARELQLDLGRRLDIVAPVNEIGERCPWPWEPERLGGAPIGMYRCGYCYAMVLAGAPHLDYSDDDLGSPSGAVTPTNE